MIHGFKKILKEAFNLEITVHILGNQLNRTYNQKVFHEIKDKNLIKIVKRYNLYKTNNSIQLTTQKFHTNRTL